MTLPLERLLKHTILTNKELVELVVRYQHGDIASGHKVLQHNYRFIYKIVELYVPPSKEYFSDVFTEAVIGMQVSMSKFDASTGVIFLSYAVWWIKNHINAYFVNQHYYLRITEPQAKAFVNAVNEGLIQDEEDLLPSNFVKSEPAKRGRPKKGEKPKLKFSYNSRYLRTALHKMLFVQPTDPKNPESDGIDTLPSHEMIPVVDDRAELRKLVDKICANMPVRYQRALKMSHGIDSGDNDITLRELATHFGNISRERVRQVRKQALRSAVHSARKEGITVQTLMENVE